MFKKYQHIERFGTDEVDGIDIGNVWIFPKIDGTNGSVWLEDGEVNAGSRNRKLSLDKDNAGFLAHVSNDERIRKYLEKHPTHRLFGEWLVPHSLKTYRESAWRKFYIFDVTIDGEEDFREYIPYEIYKPMLEEFELDYIVPLAEIKNPAYDRLIHILNQNDFLIEDGKGIGEGIVLKNYDFYNKYKRQNWAKIVCSEFKEKHKREMGAPKSNGEVMVEERIVNEYVTTALIEKTHAKIVNEKEGWRSQYIPMLLGMVFHDLVTEEIWNIVKKYKNPKIDFRRLNTMTIMKIKETKKELFN